tara:strand:+ start:81 stop:650 length:570 start_codon:yes stop_codon:yes gene_type:complete
LDIDKLFDFSYNYGIMMSQLLQQAELKSLCEHSKSFSGSVQLKDLPRLVTLLAKKDTSANYNVSFGLDGKKRLIISGDISAKLKLKCQRCMEDMDHFIELSFRLSPVRTVQESKSLPRNYEPLLISTELIIPMDIIEDELILSLPSAPKHEEQDCSVSLEKFRVKDLLDTKESPFAVLANMKNKRQIKK